ncbi:MAG: NAD(P)/FAD-dependent oxidoreductase [Spirochaetota bacterium]
MARTRKTDYLLIGGGVAAARAIETIRREDRRGRILLVGAERQLPYDRPPLSKEIITGTVQPREIVTERRRYYRTHRARLLRGRRVTGLELSEESEREGTAELDDGSRVVFSRALLATGGRPRRLGVPGEDTGVHYLRNVDDALEIAQAVSGRDNTRAVVVGGGLIGLELAASLRLRGTGVTLIEAQDRLWPPTAPRPLRDYLLRRMEEIGVTVHLGESVERIEGGRSGHVVHATRAGRLECEVVCAAVGIEPNDELARAAGVEVEDGVLVDGHFRTSDSRVYAAGDLVRFRDPYSGVWRRVEHYNNAEYGGLLAGQNMAGGDAPFEFLSNFWSDIGELHIEMAGNDTEWEELVTRGALDRPSEGAETGVPQWIGIGMNGSRIACYFAVNAPPADLSALQLLIRNRVDVSGDAERLSDPGEPLAEIARDALEAAS